MIMNKRAVICIKMCIRDRTNGGQAAKIPDAIDACINNSDGFFAFDLCHIKMYDYWNAFKTGFDNYLESVQK